MIEDIQPSPEDAWDKAAEAHYQSLVSGKRPLSFQQQLLVERTSQMVRALEKELESDE